MLKCCCERGKLFTDFVKLWIVLKDSSIWAPNCKKLKCSVLFLTLTTKPSLLTLGGEGKLKACPAFGSLIALVLSAHIHDLEKSKFWLISDAVGWESNPDTVWVFY